jgi:putative acetyltransferase
MFEIREDDLTSQTVKALIALHLDGMRANSPPGRVFALAASGLSAPDVTVWTVWSDGALAGMGALKALGSEGGEVKSMRTHPDHLRRGVAASLLEHIIRTARAQGRRRLSLETGRGPAFEPALRLYLTRGFREGEPFGEYVESDFNQYLHLKL